MHISAKELIEITTGIQNAVERLGLASSSKRVFNQTQLRNAYQFKEALTNYKLRELVEKVVLEAQGHAMEAKGQRAAVHEIYQALGIQKGDWNGAAPVLKKIAAMKEVIAILKDEAESWT